MTTAPDGQAGLVRPLRPVPLICGLVLAALAALFYGMASGTTGPDSGQYGLAFVMALLAVRFNWARITTAVLLAWQTFMWLPGALFVLGEDEQRYDMERASYAIVAAVLTVAGAVLLFLPSSNDFYRRARTWREGRRAARRQVES